MTIDALQKPSGTMGKARSPKIASFLPLAVSLLLSLLLTSCSTDTVGKGSTVGYSEQESGSGSSLDETGIASRASGLANDECSRLYQVRPFNPGDFQVVANNDEIRWGGLDVRGVNGFSALVTFPRNGSRPVVEIFYSTDKAQETEPAQSVCVPDLGAISLLVRSLTRETIRSNLPT